MGGSGDIFLDGQGREVASDVFGPQGGGVALAVEIDKVFDAVEVDFFGSEAVMTQANGSADFFQERCNSHVFPPW